MLTLPGVHARDGQPRSLARPARSRAGSSLDLDSVRAGDAGRALGRLAVLPARLGVGPSPVTSTCSRSSRSAPAPPISTAWPRLLPPGLFPPGSAGTGGTVAVYFEAAAVITVLVLLGQVLELRARDQTGRRHSRAAEPRTQDRPAPARWRRDEDIPLDQVQVGDRLRVRPGDAVPVDGVVMDGRARSTNPWSPGSRCLSQKGRATRSSAAPSTAPASLVMRADTVGADTHAVAYRVDGRGGTAQPRAHPEAGRHGRRILRPSRPRHRHRWPSSPGRSGVRRPRLPSR